MAKIAKAYRTIFVDPNTIGASDTRRAFDDAYDFFNGNLNSQNFIGNMTIAASMVSVPSSTFSSSDIYGALEELKQNGYHSLHFISTATAYAVSVYAGIVYVNGVECKVNSKISSISASNMLMTGPANITNTAYVVLVGAAVNLTASDFKLCKLTEFSASLAWNNDKQGYYPSIGSGSRRALYVFRAEALSPIATFYDEKFIDPPRTGQRIDLTTGNQTWFGFSSLGVVGVNGFAVNTITRVYGDYDQRYYFWFRGNFPNISGSHICAIHGGAFSPFPVDGWRPRDLTIFIENNNATFGNVGNILFNSATTFARVETDLINTLDIIITSSTLLTNGYWQMKYERIASVTPYRSRLEAVRS